MAFPKSCSYYLPRAFWPVTLLISVMFFLAYVMIISFVAVAPQSSVSVIGERSSFGAVGDPHLENKRESFQPTNARVEMEAFMKNVDFVHPSIPSDVEMRAADVPVNIKRVNIMGVNTFYREAIPPPGVESSQQTALLLHGAAFKSETWQNLNTINLLAAMGHRVVAVDLPGYGDTRGSVSKNEDRYIQELISSLKIRNYIIVSPSMSGRFSIPFLMKHSQELDGFVPVAPVSTHDVVSEAPNIHTPTLIVYGELDKNLGVVSVEHLSLLPNSQSVILPNARHPAYLDQPKMFHDLLYNFLKELKTRKGI